MVGCLLAAVAAAAALLPPLASAAPALQFPFKKTSQEGVSSAVFAELEGLAGLAAIVSSRDGINPVEGSPLGLEVVERWGGDVAGACGLRGFVATDDGGSGEGGDLDGRTVVVFDGDYGFDDALDDEIAPSGVEYYHGGVVHEGALNAWESVKETVTRALDEAIETSGSSQLRVIGRGIGGSVAALAALEFAMKGLKPRLTTFGQPKFGDAEFMRFFDEKIPAEDYQRVTHLTDPVPLVEHQELQFVHTNEEYLIIKPFLPYTTSDIHVCFPDSPDSDAVCSAHFRTRAFDLDFTRAPYFVDSPSPSSSSSSLYESQRAPGDVDFEITIEVVSFDLPSIGSALASPPPSIFPSSLDFGLSSLFSSFTPTIPTLSFDWAGEGGEDELAGDSPALSKRSAAPIPDISRAIEYFHAPKHVLAAAVAASEEAAEQRRKDASASPTPEGSPSAEGGEQQQRVDGEDLISKASSVILYNGRPLETNGRLLPRALSNHHHPLSRKGKPKSKGKPKAKDGGDGNNGDDDGGTTILTLERTTPSSTTSDTRIQDSTVDRTQNTRQDELVNVDKGRNFRTFNGRPVVVVKQQQQQQQEAAWGKWEDEMNSLQGMRGPVVFTMASEDPKDSAAWAGEAPDEEVRRRFLGGVVGGKL